MISIVIPVWKTRYLKEAIDSVLNQTHTEFELIIVEGRRLKDFDRIVGMYSDSRIQVKRHEVMPIVNNWNRCMQYATGVFSILLCDDDIFLENHLASLWKLAEKYPHVDLFHSRIRIVDHLGRLIGLSPSCPEYEAAHDFVYMKECYKRPQYVSDFMYRTSRFKESGGFLDRPMAWFTDVDTAYSLAIPNGIAYSNQATFIYRNSDENVSSNLDPVQALEAVRMHFEFLQEKLGELCGEGEEFSKLILHNMKGWREKDYAGAYTRTGVGRYPFSPLVNAIKYRKTYPISWRRAILASAYAMVMELNKPGISN